MGDGDGGHGRWVGEMDGGGDVETRTGLIRRRRYWLATTLVGKGSTSTSLLSSGASLLSSGKEGARVGK